MGGSLTSFPPTSFLKEKSETMEQLELLELQSELEKKAPEISEAIETADETSKPYLVPTKDTLNVVGDATKIEVAPKDYTLEFRFPIEYAKKLNGEIRNGMCVKEIDFKNVFPKPINQMTHIQMLIKLFPFFREIRDGEVETPTKEQLREMIMSFTQEIVDIMYEFVASVLEIDDSLKDNISPMSVIMTTLAIMKDFPELTAEADAFFDHSLLTQSEEAQTTTMSI